MTELTAAEVIALLELERHPEGGWYRQTFAEDAPGGDRHLSTAIYYLLEGEDLAAWHRVDAAEVWHWHAGAPLKLSVCHNGKAIDEYVLGANLRQSERPQVVVPKGCWQTARSLGPWTLVGCTVAPGFTFSGFEMAPEDWHPGKGAPK